MPQGMAPASHRAVGLVRTRRFGPGEVVHVIAVRLHGIVIQGHGHGVQLMPSVHLPLFDPLEPVGIVTLGVILAVMTGTGFLAGQGRGQAQIRQQHGGGRFKELGQLVGIAGPQLGQELFPHFGHAIHPVFIRATSGALMTSRMSAMTSLGAMPSRPR